MNAIMPSIQKTEELEDSGKAIVNPTPIPLKNTPRTINFEPRGFPERILLAVSQ